MSDVEDVNYLKTRYLLLKKKKHEAAQQSKAVDYELITPVAHYFNGDVEKTRLWFETSNPMLGDVRPCDTPRDKVLKFILEQVQPLDPSEATASPADFYRKIAAQNEVIRELSGALQDRLELDKQHRDEIIKMTNEELRQKLEGLKRLYQLGSVNDLGHVTVGLTDQDRNIVAAALEAAKMMIPQPIESAPRDGTPIIAWNAFWKYPETVYMQNECWLTLNKNKIPQSLAPTHWTPILDAILKALKE